MSGRYKTQPTGQALRSRLAHGPTMNRPCSGGCGVTNRSGAGLNPCATATLHPEGPRGRHNKTSSNTAHRTSRLVRSIAHIDAPSVQCAARLRWLANEWRDAWNHSSRKLAVSGTTRVRWPIASVLLRASSFPADTGPEAAVAVLPRIPPAKRSRRARSRGKSRSIREQDLECCSSRVSCRIANQNCLSRPDSESPARVRPTSWLLQTLFLEDFH